RAGLRIAKKSVVLDLCMFLRHTSTSSSSSYSSSYSCSWSLQQHHHSCTHIEVKAMRGLIALRKHFVQNSPDGVICFAELLACAQPARPCAGVLASLFGAITIFGGDQ